MLPALSVQVPLTVVPSTVRLSIETVVGAVQLPWPLCAAAAPPSPAQAKLTVTTALFHPCAFATGFRLTAGAFGAVLSIFTAGLLVALATLPGLSDTEPLLAVRFW